MREWVRSILADDELCKMGHCQSASSDDLGFGWLYYAIARALKRRSAVVIGSYRGFVPAVIAKAFLDDGDGRVLFIDPSLWDGFWREPTDVRMHFERCGTPNVQHFRMTTQEFTRTDEY